MGLRSPSHLGPRLALTDRAPVFVRPRDRGRRTGPARHPSACHFAGEKQVAPGDRAQQVVPVAVRPPGRRARGPGTDQRSAQYQTWYGPLLHGYARTPST